MVLQKSHDNDLPHKSHLNGVVNFPNRENDFSHKSHLNDCKTSVNLFIVSQITRL